MIKKRKQLELMILLLSSIGVRPPPLTLRYWNLEPNFRREKKEFSNYFLLFPLHWNLILKSWSIYLKVLNYEKELEEMKSMTRQEFVASLRRLVLQIVIVISREIYVLLSQWGICCISQGFVVFSFKSFSCLIEHKNCVILYTNPIYYITYFLLMQEK